MRMGRTSAWRSAAAAALLAGTLACADRITTPGRCPEYCPADTLSLVDTVLTGVLSADTSTRGVNDVERLTYLLAGDQESLRTLSYVLLGALPQRWTPTTTDTVLLGTIDSIRLSFQLDGRDTAQAGLRILFYRAPVDLDTAALTFDTLAAYAAAAPLDSVVVADSVASGAFNQIVPLAAFTPSAADSNRIALVIDARAAGPGTVTLGSRESATGPRLTFFVHGAAPRDTFSTSFLVLAEFDAFTRNPPLVEGTGPGIRVGDAPAARANLFFDLPPFLADSVTIIRAQLSLRLARPAVGRPREQFAVQAMPMFRYFGAKSVIIPDTSFFGTGTLTAGDTGTVVLELARAFRLWRGVPPDSLPRVLQLRNRFESVSLGGFEALGAGAGVDAPRLRITYVRPFRFGVP
jgi:hypothetical protein